MNENIALALAKKVTVVAAGSGEQKIDMNAESGKEVGEFFIALYNTLREFEPEKKED